MKLQLLAPGETALPGTGTGKTGTPTAQTAGTAFNATVNAVDANWNVVSTNDTVAISSSDINATPPAPASLSSGSRTFSVTLKTAGSATVTASDTTHTGITSNTTPAIAVNVGAFTKLQILLPGETAVPGSSTGKTGTPTAQTAAAAFNVTVNAVDANWNLIATNDLVAITSNDANAVLPSNAALVAGTQNFSVTLNTAGSRTVTASDLTHAGITANTSSSVTVNAAAFVQLQLLVPGETTAPGTATGKTGAPTARTAGTAFNVTVNAVDANWNLVNTVTDLAGISASDLNAALPANTTLSGGTRTFAVTLKTVGSATVTASDLTDTNKTAYTSPAITVNAGAFTKLQLLVPGETAIPGSATGKTGTPTAQTAGAGYTVTVNAVDANWNLVSTNDAVGITCTDPNRVLPANAALVAGTKSLSLTNKTVGSWTITASDSTHTGITANTSPSITVNAALFTKLQLLVPGETASPGSATGKTGSPTAQTACTSSCRSRKAGLRWQPARTPSCSSSIPTAALPSPPPMSLTAPRPPTPVRP